ncbi:BREX system P-loop protein BrxC, partial [Candidatus Kaiserbacteria bacterium]|nr:BREX system P-loop protein BrxC [Candidatus Kaiserbacteria bacterium]
MLNRDIYQKDPSTRKLVNEGVASVNDEKTHQALSVLRYELETFVCDGQYEKGLEHILDVYLKNIEQAEQPAVWVSGFYGSGKSHLVKMLRALWVDSVFDDGATARGIANLPQGVSDQLKELSTQAKRHGGLHAASGTLGSSSRDKSVRMALLGILFKSVGLPEQYNIARFIMWLQKEGIYESVKTHVEEHGGDWNEEISDPNVAEGIYAALCAIKPNLFSANSAVTEVLPQLFPIENDVSSGDMLKAIRQALTRDGKFPLTLVVLDEVQQYIGEDSQRSIDVQEVVEACCKNIGAKMLFIGTGQTAVTGTSNLKKLEGRFTVRVELSDADVDAVIRKVILAKKPEAKAPVEKVMQTNLGEISRHLAGATIGHRGDDIQFFPQDYPILPVRRRFWESTLRVLDQTGTDSQLRNQLSM